MRRMRNLFGSKVVLGMCLVLLSSLRTSCEGAENILIDTDVGYDDIVAISLILKSPRFRDKVVGITTVRGNAHVVNGTENILRLLTIAERSDIPVSPGPRTLAYGGTSFRPKWMAYSEALSRLSLPKTDLKPINLSASDFILEHCRMAKAGSITILAIGPLTNLASALQKDRPAMMKAVKSIVMMGGNSLGIDASLPSLIYLL